jgi:hypothetical protein
MTDNPFDSRPLGHVFMNDFTHVVSDEDTGISATVLVSVTRLDGKPDGPSVQIQLMVPVDYGKSLRDAQLAVLDRTLHLLKRIGNENAERLLAQWETGSRQAAERAKNEISLGPVMPAD